MVATYVPGPHGPMVFASTAGGGAVTTWNPSDKSASLSLSGGNLIATAAADNQGVRTIGQVATNQKVYMEYVPTVNADNQQFGFVDLTHDLTTAFGVDGHSIGIKRDGTYLDGNSADNNAAMPSWTTGDRVGIAFNSQTLKFWSRVNGGAWSNSGDPAAGTGGRTVSALGAFYATVWIQFNTEVTTARFASTDWVDTAPSGFTQLLT